MPITPTDLAQSFRLRFWREPRLDAPGQWRGTVWHEQQMPHEYPSAVNDPEEAFDFVRRALQIPSAHGGAKDHASRSAFQTPTLMACCKSLRERLLNLFGKFTCWRKNQ
jgi:hypothetical protein